MSSVLRRPPFVALDREQAIRVYRRNLPHWRQQRATYFVTFRLHDAMPADAVDRINHQEATWLASRGIHDVLDRQKIFDSLARQDQFLYRRHLNRLREDVHEGHGACWLARSEIADELRTQILCDDGERSHVGDFVIMPNHVHLLIVPDGRELELCLKRIKGRSATFCNRLLGRSGTFWQADSFDHIVRDIEFLRKYIQQNPNNAGINIPKQAYYRADWL
jgi:putative transposase